MIKLSFLGDLSLGEHYFSFGHGPKSFAKKNYLFKEVENELKKADFVIANLEGPISNKGMDERDPEKMVFRGSPDIIAQLKQANINILNLANNHILQHGEDVFFDTINLLEESNISVIGKNGQSALIINNGTEQIALFGCSDIEDNICKHQNLYQKVDDDFYALLIDAVSRYNEVIVTIHWGREDKHKPTERQIEIENKLKSIGVKFIIGHHPHIFYPIKWHKDFFCAYSLGDFIFDLTWDEKLIKTAILNLQFNDKSILSDVEITPVRLYQNGCIPKPSGPSIKMNGDHIDLYQFSSAVKNLQAKKLNYFLANFIKGNTSLKMTFITNKIKLKLGIK